MKPKQLKSPFTWDTRRPLFTDGVLFVPQYYADHSQAVFPGVTDPQVFAKPAPVYIEYCSGNGAWIVEKAQQFPQFNWIAVEKRFDRVRKIWSKMRNLNLGNLLVVCGEAQPFSRYYLSEHSIDGCYINFPDPWPKDKHAKHRLFQSAFIQEIARIMVPGGKAIVATDDAVWSERICAAMLGTTLWQSVFPAPFYVNQWPDYGTSYFNELWLEKGKEIHYMQFVNHKEL